MIDINQTEIVVRNESSVILVYDLVSSFFTTSSDYLIEFQDLPIDTLCFLELTNTTASAGEDEGAEMPDVLLMIKFRMCVYFFAHSSHLNKLTVVYTLVIVVIVITVTIIHSKQEYNCSNSNNDNNSNIICISSSKFSIK